MLRVFDPNYLSENSDHYLTNVKNTYKQPTTFSFSSKYTGIVLKHYTTIPIGCCL